jgi:hypothetical protein
VGQVTVIIFKGRITNSTTPPTHSTYHTPIPIHSTYHPLHLPLDQDGHREVSHLSATQQISRKQKQIIIASPPLPLLLFSLLSNPSLSILPPLALLLLSRTSLTSPRTWYASLKRLLKTACLLPRLPLQHLPPLLNLLLNSPQLTSPLALRNPPPAHCSTVPRLPQQGEGEAATVRALLSSLPSNKSQRVRQTLLEEMTPSPCGIFQQAPLAKEESLISALYPLCLPLSRPPNRHRKLDKMETKEGSQLSRQLSICCRNLTVCLLTRLMDSLCLIILWR